MPYWIQIIANVSINVQIFIPHSHDLLVSSLIKETLGILWIFIYFGNLTNAPFLHKLDDFMYVENNTYNEVKHKTQHLPYIQFALTCTPHLKVA